MFAGVFDELKALHNEVRSQGDVFEAAPESISYVHPVWVNAKIHYIMDEVAKFECVNIVLGHHHDERFSLVKDHLTKWCEEMPLKVLLIEKGPRTAMIRSYPKDKKYYEIEVLPNFFSLKQYDMERNLVPFILTKEVFQQVIEIPLKSLKF